MLLLFEYVKNQKNHPISCMNLFLQISSNSIWIMFDLVELFTMWKVHSRCLKKTTVYYSDSIINCMNERDFSGNLKGFPRNWFVWKVNRKNSSILKKLFRMEETNWIQNEWSWYARNKVARNNLLTNVTHIHLVKGADGQD